MHKFHNKKYARPLVPSVSQPFLFLVFWINQVARRSWKRINQKSNTCWHNFLISAILIEPQQFKFNCFL